MKNAVKEGESNGSPSDLRYKRSSLKDYFREYTSKTSLHGIQYFGEDSSIFEKIWWFIMVMSSFMTCIFLIQKVWNKWDQSPVIVSFSEAPTPIWQIPFPAITICPAAQVDQTIYNFSQIYEMKHNLSERELFRLNYVALLCHNDLIETGFEFINESAIKDMLKVTPIFDNALVLCDWYKESNECDNYFVPILTEYGSCFTTNILNAKDIYREDVVNIKYAENNMFNEGWSIDKGYSKNLSLNTYPLRALNTGLKSSLKITLLKDTNSTDYICSGMIDGFKVSLHPPNVIPRTFDSFFWAPLEKWSIVNIQPKMMTTSEGLKDYHPQRRQCFFAKERHLRFFKEYTQENCQLECVANFTLAKCGCVTFSMPRTKGTPICGTKKRKCVQNALEKNFLQEIASQFSGEIKFDDDLMTDMKGVQHECNCLSSCSSIIYESEISQSKINWEKYYQTTRIPSTNGLQLGVLEFYFKESQFITSRRSELYGLIDFLSNCGGLLGLCLGFSILSLIEMIYFITLRLFYHLKGRSRTHVDTQ